MPNIDPRSLSDRDNFKLMTGSIIPRPVALVTSLSGKGVLNAAPFSYFNIVSSNPPMISLSIQRINGVRKDTSRNIADIGAFVVHISDESSIVAINLTAVSVPPEVSEVTMANLTPIKSEKICVPGIAESRIRMECKLNQMITLGGTPSSPSCDLIIGEVVSFYIADELYEGGRIDPDLLKPIARLAGNDYAKLGERFALDRPE